MTASQKFVRGNGFDPVKREKDDFYPTPRRGVEALLAVEAFEGSIWEPACGDGAISDVLEEYYPGQVWSTDLIERGYGLAGVDFLAPAPAACCDHIITNPPFKLAEHFVRLSLIRSRGKVAMLLRLSWLEGSKRRVLFESTPLARVWVFSSRLSIGRGADRDMGGGGGGMIAFAWFVWDKTHIGPPVIGWLP
jgi:hypothetical protein